MTLKSGNTAFLFFRDIHFFSQFVMPVSQYIEVNTVLSSGDCYVIGFFPNHAQSLAYTEPVPPPLNVTSNQKRAIIPCSALVVNRAMLGAPSCAHQRIILIFIYVYISIVIIYANLFYSQQYFTLPSLFLFYINLLHIL